MIKFADPSAQYRSYKKRIDAAINRVLESEKYILGEEVEKLEDEFARYIGTSNAIGVANGTDAIEISLRALEIGVGDEVITVSHTAVATVAAIEAAGAKPVLVDVDPRFFTLDPKKLSEVLSKKTKAIILVHLYGNSGDIEGTSAFCKKNNLYLIEDVSQAHGAKWKDRRLGSIGEIGCFSCFPTKNLGAIGDAGLITTNNEEIAKKIFMLREYGWKERVSQITGRNSRLDEIQAAILRIKLEYLDEDNKKRKILAQEYDSILSSNIVTPEVRKQTSHVYHLYVVQLDQRDRVLDYLKQQNIIAGIHYPLAVHQQPAYLNRLKTSKTLVITENLTKDIISLPIYPELPLSKVEQVANLVNKIS